MVGARLAFDRRDLKRVKRAYKQAPRILERNMDKANRHTANAVMRSSIRNITKGTGNGYTAVDNGDLKRSVTKKRLGDGDYEVGSDLKQATYMETGTGLHVEAPKSVGTFRSHIKRRARKPVRPRRKKYLKFEVRGGRKTKRPPPRKIAGRKTFVKHLGGNRRLVFTTATQGTPARRWLSEACKSNRRTHLNLQRKAIAAALGEVARR